MKKLYLVLSCTFISFGIQAQTITVGTDNTTPTSGNQYRSPYSAVYDYSYVQTIYLQSEIDHAGTIKSISYNFFGPSLANSNNLAIYMGEVSRNEFDGSYTDWEPLSTMTKVFDNTVDPGTLPGWVNITLQTPFKYNNTGNLLISIFEKSPGSDYVDGLEGNAFGVTDVGTRRVIYFVNDGTAPDPNNPPEADNYRSKIGNIKITFGPAAPVTISSFTASANGNSNKLNWVTETEQNNKGFEILASGDGTTFKTIGFADSKAPSGSSSKNVSYEFVDSKPAPAITYYRLKQMDLDGKSELSKVVSVKNVQASLVQVNLIYPNPVKNQLNFVISSAAATNAKISIANAEGKIIFRQIANLLYGDNKIEMNTSSYQKGVYSLRVETNENNTVITKQFIKK